MNTVVIEGDGTTLGHNTDAAGFLRSLREAGFRPEGARALVLGAGARRGRWCTPWRPSAPG